MTHNNRTVRILGSVAVACACSVFGARAQEPACRTGATALADAYVLANPLYSYFFGNLEQYVANNVEHFRADGDAVRCAAALSQAFLRSAIQLHDPGEQGRRDQLNAQLGAWNISPGPQESSPSSQLYGVAMQLSRLARVLPAAASGDYGPLWTPTTELEQMQIVAGQMLRMLLQDPDMRDIMSQVEPLIRELARLEHEALRRAAETLANAR